MTITEAFALYRDDVIVPKNQSHKTEENHQIACDRLVSYFSDVDIEDLDRAAIRAWRINLERTRQPQTVRNYVIKLRVVLGYLREEGYDVVDPAKVAIPKRAEPIVNCLTAAQVEQFILGAKLGKKINRIKAQAIISLLYSTGLRVSEVCRLNREDVLGKDSFTILSKGGVAAPSFIDKRSQTYIRAYLRLRDDDMQALFITEQGNRIRPVNVQETFQYVSKVTGIKATPHTLRHSFATNLMRNGADVRHVQRFLKHKNIQSTAIYLHVYDAELHSLHRKFHST